MLIKNKRTGVIWGVQAGSPTARRIAEQPDDYEEVNEVVRVNPQIIKKKVLEG
jgi:hypothetical protein